MKSLDSLLNPLLKFLDQYYAKLPALPKGGKDFLVKAAPWYAVIFGVLGVIGVVLGLLATVAGTAAVGMGAAVSGYMPAYGRLAGGMAFVWVALLFALVVSVLELLAFSPLKALKVKGWNLLLYTFLLGFLSALLSNVFYLGAFSVMGIAWSLLWFLVDYYLLYQVKSYYK